MPGWDKFLQSKIYPRIYFSGGIKLFVTGPMGEAVRFNLGSQKIRVPRPSTFKPNRRSALSANSLPSDTQLLGCRLYIRFAYMGSQCYTCMLLVFDRNPDKRFVITIKNS